MNLDTGAVPQDALSLTQEDWESFCRENGEPSWRAGQIFSWLHRKNARSFAEMTDLPGALREKLSAAAEPQTVRLVRMLESKHDGTRKLLFKLYDGNLIESVLMRYRFGLSVCVSSQVGCRMGCRFCASTVDGLVRNLSAGEMLGQVYTAGDLTGERIAHMVVMGSGEPMENYDAVIRFIRILADERGKNMSLRNISVSTCGIVPGIRRLAGERLPVNLAVSLHAPNDEIRQILMPVAHKYPMDELLDACGAYCQATRRQLTWEYAMVHGVNDREEHAQELAFRLKRLCGVVNLIPVNPVTERGLHPASRETVRRFQRALEDSGVRATVRRTLGRDIDGACGQLRRRVMSEEEGTG